MLKLERTLHRHSCEKENYFNNESDEYFDNWQNFKETYFSEDGTFNHDYYHCFRFDMKETGYDDSLQLELFIMVQDHGWYKSATIGDIKQEDLDEINAYLKECWEYLQGQWVEFSR